MQLRFKKLQLQLSKALKIIKTAIECLQLAKQANYQILLQILQREIMQVIPENNLNKMGF